MRPSLIVVGKAPVSGKTPDDRSAKAPAPVVGEVANRVANRVGHRDRFESYRVDNNQIPIVVKSTHPMKMAVKHSL